MRLPEIPLQIPSGILKNTKFVFFGVFFWYFRGIFSIPCRRGNLYVGLVFLAYFGVCGVFCSVAGSWVVNPRVVAITLAISGHTKTRPGTGIFNRAAPGKWGRPRRGSSSSLRIFSGYFLTFRVISILQGYFWRPSENAL